MGKTSKKAGVIVVKKIDGIKKVLLLRLYKNFDIPKGHVEYGETTFETALREVHEETNIDDLNFRWGIEPFVSNNITVYIAQTNKHGEILPNPDTGIIEHHQIFWITFEEAKLKINKNLQPAIEWGEKTVRGWI